MSNMLSLKYIEEIRANPEGTSWFEISFFRGLSEDFIREFADRLDWTVIIQIQVLSQDFILEMMEKIQPKVSEEELVNRCQNLGYDIEKIQKSYRMCQMC